MGLRPELPQLPAGDGPVAGALVSEGLCPWCGSDLEPQGVGDGPPLFGWCDFDEMGWSLTVGGTEPTVWFADEVEELTAGLDPGPLLR